jgi:two-component system, LytTR family, response regulator
MLRAIIIDDELAGINILSVLINRLEMDVRVIATSTDEEKGIELIENYRPDILFLDIQMPKMTGFELLENLTYKDFKLVFTTAHREFAIQAIKNKASDYLLKPIDAEELRSCLESLLNNVNMQDNIRSRTLIEVPAADGTILVKQQNIMRLEASGSYTTIYLKDGTKYTASKNLKHFELLLDPQNFHRCHISHVINLNEVTKLINNDGYFALMSNDSTVEISKKNRDSLLAKLKSL